MTLKKIHSELAKQVKKNFGTRCEEFSWGCIECQAWRVVDEVEEMEKDLNPRNWKPAYSPTKKGAQKALKDLQKLLKGKKNANHAFK
jgi:hypothetical protein